MDWNKDFRLLGPGDLLDLLETINGDIEGVEAQLSRIQAKQDSLKVRRKQLLGEIFSRLDQPTQPHKRDGAST